jgi:hypothetical protein
VTGCVPRNAKHYTVAKPDHQFQNIIIGRFAGCR